MTSIAPNTTLTISFVIIAINFTHLIDFKMQNCEAREPLRGLKVLRPKHMLR